MTLPASGSHGGRSPTAVILFTVTSSLFCTPLLAQSNVGETSDVESGDASMGESLTLSRLGTVPTRSEQEAYWTPPVVHSLGLFAVMRGTEAYLWPDPFSFHQIDRWPERYAQAFTRPPKFDKSRPFMTWDGDRWQINVLGHGLLGSELYLRPRRCGFGVLGSVGFATLASALWEYGFEANGVRPSGVDLWYTPMVGLVLGEARFGAWRAARGIRQPLLRAMVRSIVDPMGEFSTNVVGASC